jgi:Tfp pilus assembly protein PilF
MKKPESYPLKQSANPATQESMSNSQAVVTDVLIRAGAIARRGDLLQAEDLLKTLPDRDSSRVEVIDLLARIYAQQGKIDQAQALWLKALQGDPSNTRFLSALKLCACLKKPRFEQFVLRYLWVLLVVILWFLVATAIIVSTVL